MRKEGERNKRGEGCYDFVGGYYRWRLGLGVDPITGKTRYKTIKAKSSATLHKKVAEWQKDNYNGGELSLLVPNKRVTMEQWVEVWLTNLEGKIEATTLDTYKRNANTHILPRFGEITLGKVTPNILQAYFDALAKTHAPSTVKTIRAVFRACFSKAIKFGLITKNPVMQTDPPKYVRPNLRILDEADVKKILEIADDCSYCPPARIEANEYIMKRNYLVILLAVASGMRQGEILGLTWSCVQGARLEITHSLYRSPGHNGKLKTPKNDKERTIYIPPKVADKIEEWRKYQNEYAEKYKGLFTNKLDLVFTNSVGSPTDSCTFTQCYFRPICRTAGLEKVRFHDLRHFWASSALSKGVPIMAVSKHLGHSSIAITFERYTHVLQKSRDELREMIDNNPLFD